MSQYEPSRSYQQPYPPYPPYPPYQPPPPWEGAPPTAVRYARNLIYVAIGLSLVRLAVLILIDNSPNLPEALDVRVSDNLSTAAYVTAVAFGTLSSGAIWFVATMFIMRAASWVRIVVAILCGLDVTSLLWVLLGSLLTKPGDRLDTWIIAMDVISALVIAAATVLLWTRESSRFFKSGGYPS